MWRDYVTAAHTDVAIAGLAYEQATAARDAAFWDMHTNGGYSLREIARLVGVDGHEQIRKCIMRHAKLAKAKR